MTVPREGDWMIVAWPKDKGPGVMLECGDAQNLDGAYLNDREEMEAFIADLRAKADEVWGET